MGRAAAAAAIPDEVRAAWAARIGTWVADNSAYKSEDDPHDAFGIDWSWGIGQTRWCDPTQGVVSTSSWWFTASTKS
jgi:hypothetical protein